MSIVFHIGHPKTGTTLLQKEVFPKHGFLGSSGTIDRPESKILEFKIRDRVNFDTVGHWGSAISDPLVRDFCNIASHWNERNPLIYSSEHWLRGPASFYPAYARPKKHQGNHPRAIQHLNALKNNIGVSGERVKVLITIRSQRTLLPSLYAQLSNRYMNPGSAHFDQLVARMFSDPGWDGAKFLDYYSIFCNAAEVVGEKNVLLLPIESIHTNEYWSRLSEFIGRRVEFPSSRQNVRSTGVGVNKQAAWHLRGMDVLGENCLVYGSRKLLGWRYRAVQQRLRALKRESQGRGVFCPNDSTLRTIFSMYLESNTALQGLIGVPQEYISE